MTFLNTIIHSFEHFFSDEGRKEPAAPLTPQQQFARTASELGQSLGALNELGRSLQERFPVEGAPAAETVDRELQDTTYHRHRMRDAILKAHQQLGTGLEVSMLEALDQGMEQLLPHLGDCAGQDIAKRVTSCCLHRIFREVGLLSWDRVMHLIDRAGLKWPPPSGMSPSATSEEIAQAAERNRCVDGESFLDRSPAQARELMLGVVKVWRAAYPAENTSLWQETVWQGVAAGLRIYLFEQAAAAMQHDPQNIASVQRLLEQELQSTRDLLSQGLQSPAQLKSVLAETDRLCRQDVPDLVWELVRPQVCELLVRPPVVAGP